MISYRFNDSETIPINALTDSDEEEIVLHTRPLGTRSGRTYLRQYEHEPNTEEAPQATPAQEAGLSQPAAPAPQPDKGKQKDLRFNQALKKTAAAGLDAPFRFDILTQLANIPARITLHELLRLSKETREALREALAQPEALMAHLPPALTQAEEEKVLCAQCHIGMDHVPSITFTNEDMLLKDNKHDRPLYHTGYIGSACIESIQVDPGSVLSIVPRRVMHFLGIPLHSLSKTATMIYGFNSGSNCLLGKICLKCQIVNLRSEMTCYVIDANTSYNMLLGRP